MSISQHHRRAALITGAAGRVGQQICASQAGQGRNIIGLYRENLPKAHKNVLPLCCDLRQIDSLVAPLKSTDTVVHLAWQEEFHAPNPAPKNPEIYARESLNVIMTQNLIHAMERAGTKRIIFLSWVGVDRHAQHSTLRQKYWAENAIINSQIPEKIIIRAGLISSREHIMELTRVAGVIAKWPLLLPLPKEFQDVVVTTMSDIVQTINEVLKSPSAPEAQCRIIDLTSTQPVAGARILGALDVKIWNKKRLHIGGFIGQWLYRCLESKFGLGRFSEPRLRDYFTAATLPGRAPASGLPGTSFGVSAGQKQDILQAI
jgi:uncharacterized protein YbjT (DUF2867 family)